MKKHRCSILPKLFFLLFIVISLCFRTDDFVLIRSIQVNADFFTVDILGNLYAVQKKTLTLYNDQGNVLHTYDNKSSGDITAIDASNPLKILVYYKDFNQIVFLDKTLSISGSPISLEELGISQSSFACTSYDNAFWVYDNTKSQLLRFDKNLVIQNQSENLSQIVDKLDPCFMTEQNNSLYLCDPAKGILIFDKYGTYNKTLPVLKCCFLQVFDNKLFYLSDNMLKAIDLQNYNETSIELPEKEITGVQWNNDHLFLSKKNGISVYKITQNR
jgi:hypothetical protein